MLKKEYSHFDVSHVTIVTKPNFYYLHDIVLNDLLLSSVLNCGGKWLADFFKWKLPLSLLSSNKDICLPLFLRYIQKSLIVIEIA